jgi:hypothetical protein
MDAWYEIGSFFSDKCVWLWIGTGFMVWLLARVLHNRLNMVGKQLSTFESRLDGVEQTLKYVASEQHRVLDHVRHIKHDE